MYVYTCMNGNKDVIHNDFIFFYHYFTILFYWSFLIPYSYCHDGDKYLIVVLLFTLVLRALFAKRGCDEPPHAQLCAHFFFTFTYLVSCAGQCQRSVRSLTRDPREDPRYMRATWQMKEGHMRDQNHSLLLTRWVLFSTEFSPGALPFLKCIFFCHDKNSVY